MIFTAVDIGPKIGIDGEKEFRKNLNNINQQLRTLGSEMKAVTSAFTAGDDAQENYSKQTQVLNKQIDTQEKKLEELRKGLDASVKKYGEADNKTLRWQQAVNDATAELNKMRSQLKKAEDAMEGLNDETDDSVDLFGKLDDALGTTGLGKTLATGLGVGAVVGGVKELSSALIGVVQDTQEYRSVMASLENSSQRAGYSAEQTAETYKQLYGVLGDNQTAATATANLQALGLGQANLTKLTDIAIGAWATYGDSIPIDGLAEAINETIQAGKVTGNFADVLNWAGINEDEFNEKLEESATFGDKVNLVMTTLAEEGLAEAGQAWRENNRDIVEMNESTMELEQEMGRLGELLSPLAASIVGFAADALGFLIDQTRSAIEGIREMNRAAKEAGTSLSGQGFNFDFVDPAESARLAEPVNAKNAQIAADVVNGLQTAVAGGPNIRVEVPLNINGQEFARATVEDFRAVERANPEVFN